MRVRMFGVFKAIERWASQSDDRMRLMVISIWVGFGVTVVAFIMILAWFALPREISGY